MHRSRDHLKFEVSLSTAALNTCTQWPAFVIECHHRTRLGPAKSKFKATDAMLLYLIYVTINKVLVWHDMIMCMCCESAVESNLAIIC